MNSIKDEILSRGVKGMPPEEIYADLLANEITTTKDNISKTLSKGRRQGLAIPNFNRPERKRARQVEKAALTSSLSEGHLNMRKKVATLFVRDGLTVAEIISMEDVLLDPIETTALCKELEPYREEMALLRESKGRGLVGPDASTYLDAARELLTKFENASSELDKSQSACYSLRAENFQLKQRITGLEKDLAESSRKFVSLNGEHSAYVSSSKDFQGLVEKYGFPRFHVLLDRVNRFEEVNREMGEAERRKDAISAWCIGRESRCRERVYEANERLIVVKAAREKLGDTGELASDLGYMSLLIVDSAANGTLWNALDQLPPEKVFGIYDVVSNSMMRALEKDQNDRLIRALLNN